MGHLVSRDSPYSFFLSSRAILPYFLALLSIRILVLLLEPNKMTKDNNSASGKDVVGRDDQVSSTSPNKDFDTAESNRAVQLDSGYDTAHTNSVFDVSVTKTETGTVSPEHVEASNNSNGKT